MKRFLRSSLLVAFVAAATLSCSDANAPTISAAPAVGSSASLLGGLLNGLFPCTPQPYASASQVIGPLGGTLQVGPHTLVIPAGALQTPVEITGEAPSDQVVSVRFSPQGLQFAPGKPASLTLDYGACPLGSLMILKQIDYTTDDLNILSVLASQDNLLTKKVTAPLEHFSRYAVAW